MNGMDTISGFSGFGKTEPTEAVSAEKDRKTRAQSERSYPTADIHPPYTRSSTTKLRSPEMVQWVSTNVPSSIGRSPDRDFAIDLLFSYLFEEGIWGMSQEQLLCLGRANDGGTKTLVERLQGGWNNVGQLWVDRRTRMMQEREGLVDETAPTLTVVTYWASGDFMIPLKGRGQSASLLPFR